MKRKREETTPEEPFAKKLRGLRFLNPPEQDQFKESNEDNDSLDFEISVIEKNINKFTLKFETLRNTEILTHNFFNSKIFNKPTKKFSQRLIKYCREFYEYGYLDSVATDLSFSGWGKKFTKGLFFTLTASCGENAKTKILAEPEQNHDTFFNELIVGFLIDFLSQTYQEKITYHFCWRLLDTIINQGNQIYKILDPTENHHYSVNQIITFGVEDSCFVKALDGQKLIQESNVRLKF